MNATTTAAPAASGAPDLLQQIRQRPPTSDTYSAASTQEEFFFRLPFDITDVLWYAMEHNVPIAEVAQEMGLEEIQVQRAYADFTRKHRTTDYLRLAPIHLSEPETSLS